MANMYEHKIYVPMQDGSGQVGTFMFPMITTQPIVQMIDPFFRGGAMYHCAVCELWFKSACAAKDPNQCMCLEVNMLLHVRDQHPGAPYRDMVRSTFEVVPDRLKDLLIEQVPGLERVLDDSSDWDISELTKEGPSEDS